MFVPTLMPARLSYTSQNSFQMRPVTADEFMKIQMRERKWHKNNKFGGNESAELLFDIYDAQSDAEMIF